MTRKVVVEMTVAEAKALWSAAGTTVDHPDAVEWMNASTRAAMYRGHDKLGAAWAAAERKEDR